MQQLAKIGRAGAITFIISSMVGVGVFTSLGYQLLGTTDLFAIVMLWVVGAAIALSGALVYGELGAVMPRSGGEYNYLSVIYHPSLGFMAGFISMTIGFAAPAAFSSLVFGSYLHEIFPILNARDMAVVLVALVTVIHCIGIKQGVRFQTISTLLNICLILLFIVCGFTMRSPDIRVSFVPTAGSLRSIFSNSFAISLIYVYYAYSGWNAVAYISSEIKNLKQRLPMILITGTLFVAALYVLLNMTFLVTAPISELKGNEKVGLISAIHIFGNSGGKIAGIMIAFLLLAMVSSMVFAGPRIIQVMGEDTRLLKFCSIRRSNGVPWVAIIVQAVISLSFIIWSDPEVIINYVGFTLNLCCFLAVAGVFVHRFRFPDAERPYKTWGYPITPLIFLAIMVYTMWYMISSKPSISLWGFITAATGIAIYFFDKVFFHFWDKLVPRKDER
jgi:basic amino acid/polyamine antiporter, APA family